MTKLPAGVGHNSATVESASLRQFLERVEKLTKERGDINADIREVFAEAKAQGFDVRGMREMLKLRALDPAVRAEREATREAYLAGLDLI